MRLTRNQGRCWAAGVLLVFLGLAAGCQEQPGPTWNHSEGDTSQGGGLEVQVGTGGGGAPLGGLHISGGEAAVADPADWPAEGDWEVVYLGGERAGLGRRSREEVEIDGRQLVQWEYDHFLRLRRFGEVLETELHIESVQTPEGGLVSFAAEMNSAGSSSSSEGHVEGGELTIETSSQGSSESFTMPWQAEYRGPFGMEQVVMGDPLEPGEIRSFSALTPVFNQVAVYELRAADYERTELLEGTVELLKIDSQFTLPGQPAMPMTMWTDRTGQIMKVHLPGIEQTTFASSRELALEDTGAPRIDLADLSVVRVATPLRGADRAERIVYRVHLPEGDPAAVFVVGESQAVESIDAHTAEITVRALRGDEGAAGDGAAEGFVPSEPAGAADRAANSLVQSEDAGVVELARSIAPGEEDPWRLALALEAGVHEAISAKNFSQAFASAAEVARSREGDCTEHAVLLAALCRARGLPARVVAGLVYYPPEQGFAYHMWNEVWVGDRWIPLDATLGEGVVGADHIKLTESNLAGASAYSAFVPVLLVMRQVEIEVVEGE